MRKTATLIVAAALAAGSIAASTGADARPYRNGVRGYANPHYGYRRGRGNRAAAAAAVGVGAALVGGAIAAGAARRDGYYGGPGYGYYGPGPSGYPY